MRHGRLIAQPRMARRAPLRRCVLFAAALAALALATLLPAALPIAAAQESNDINVRRMVLSEASIAPGAQQLFQVTLSNAGKAGVLAGLRAELRDSRERRVGSPQVRKVTLPAKDEQRFLFKFTAPSEPGDYAVRFEVLSADYARPLIPGGPVFFSPFVVGQAPGAAASGGAQQARASVPRFQAPAGLSFERPDLLWEKLSIDPPNLLLGETLRVRADLRNVGGDLARDIAIRVEYFNTRTPDRTTTISESAVQVLAPGERLELEFETVLPDDALLGEYRVVLFVDPADSVDELDENNNRVTTDAIRLSRIKLIFPEPGYAFEEQGLFLFRWDSLRYQEYKVQVGTDPTFTEAGSYFDLPQGAKWTRDKEIVPLEGELPGMAQGLLERGGAEMLHWRVLGRNAEGRTEASVTQPFTIRVSPKPEPTAPPATESGGQRPAGSPRSAGSAQNPAPSGAQGTAPPGAQGTAPPGAQGTAPSGSR